MMPTRRKSKAELRRAAQRAWKSLRRQRGAQARIATGLNIRHQAVQQWEIVPLERVFDVARVTGVPHHLLRPDFFNAGQQFAR